jgi:hypothetical protein
VLLHPKKSKTLILETSRITGMSENIIEDVTSFYWEEVRKSLSSLKHQRIHLTNLGDFTIKHWKLEDKINSLEKWEETNKQKGMQQMTARFKIAENLFDLRNLRNIIKEENQRKDFIKLHKDESKRKHNKDMEEQGSDNRGDNK